MDTEALVTCPYNKVHRVSERRLQRHLLKCKDNHTQTTLLVCKFDTTHIVDRMEYEHHMATCLSSGHIRADKYVRESDVPLGCVNLEDIKYIQQSNTNTEENWDEIDNRENTYNPEHNLSTRNVYRMCIAGSKAEKKKFKNMERERFMNLQDNVSGSGWSVASHVSIMTDADGDTPLRSPRHPAKVCLQMGPSKQLNRSTCSKQMNKTEDVILNNSVDNITSMIEKKLSLTSTCNNSVKVNTECRNETNVSNSTNSTRTSQTNNVIGNDSRVTKTVTTNKSISENGTILPVRKTNNLEIRDDEKNDVAKVMARFSSGRGWTKAHKDLKAFIDRQPGVPLRRPKQEATAVLQKMKVSDVEKFSDDV